MHLPSEVMLLIMESLGHRDLKSARLVSKLWRSWASGSLFTTIYVSANKVDLDAFTAITDDPLLSTCVRRLVYDGSEFMLNYSKTEYLDSLRSQTSSIFHQHKSRLSEYQDQKFRDLMGHQPDFEAAKQQLEDSTLVTEGYKKYHEHAVYQHHSLRSGSFVNSLAQGLRKLSLLNTIQVLDQWPLSWQDDQGFGSLLARNWSLFHVHPADWIWEQDPMSSAYAKPHGTGHYFIIVSALVRAQRKIRNFSIYDIPPEIFNRSDHSKPSVLGLDIVAFAGLEMLNLSLASWCAGESHIFTSEICPNIDGLRIMLSSMTRLKTLNLCLPDTGRYEYDQVFPNDAIWTQLETLAFFDLSSKTTDVLDLLTFQMPKLRNLTIGDIYLSDGIWEGVIECLQQYSKLSNLDIDSFPGLYQHNGKEFTCPFHKPFDTVRSCRWRQEISHYVTHGGRHPSLMPDQPDSAAEDFAKDLKPFLRCCTSSQPTRIAETC